MKVSEIPQSHRRQPVVCLVYAVAVRSQSTHHFLLKYTLGHAASLFGVQQPLSVTGDHTEKKLAKKRNRNKHYCMNEHAKQVLTVKKNIHLILLSSTRALVTMPISAAPKG